MPATNLVSSIQLILQLIKYNDIFPTFTKFWQIYKMSDHALMDN